MSQYMYDYFTKCIRDIKNEKKLDIEGENIKHQLFTIYGQYPL